MNYIVEQIEFRKYAYNNFLSSNAMLLWYTLFGFNNEFGWVKWFKMNDERLKEYTAIRRAASITAARNELVEHGLIEYRQGIKGQPSEYHMVSYEVYATDSGADEEPVNIADEPVDDYISEPEAYAGKPAEKNVQDVQAYPSETASDASYICQSVNDYIDCQSEKIKSGQDTGDYKTVVKKKKANIMYSRFIYYNNSGKSKAVHNNVGYNYNNNDTSKKYYYGRASGRNRFNNFHQRDYGDEHDMELMLLSNNI